MTDPLDELQERFETVKQRLSVRHDTVVGLVTEYGSDASGGQAHRDPRLEAAEDAYSDADDAYQLAAMRLLGLDIPDDEEEEEDETLLADDFFVHLVVGVPEDATVPLLDAVVEIVDNAAQPVVQRLFDAGYTVPEWGVSRGDPYMGEGPEEAT